MPNHPSRLQFLRLGHHSRAARFSLTSSLFVVLWQQQKPYGAFKKVNFFDMNITKYLTDVRREMNHVTWPSRAEALTYTGIVVAVSVVVALFAAAVDFGMLQFVKWFTI